MALSLLQIILLIAVIVCSSIAGALRYNNYLPRVLKQPPSLVKVADGQIDYQQLFNAKIADNLGTSSMKRLEAITLSKHDQILQETIGNIAPDILIWFSLYTYVDKYKENNQVPSTSYIFKKRSRPLNNYPFVHDHYQKDYAILSKTSTGHIKLTTLEHLPVIYQDILETHENHAVD